MLKSFETRVLTAHDAQGRLSVVHYSPISERIELLCRDEFGRWLRPEVICDATEGEPVVLRPDPLHIVLARYAAGLACYQLLLATRKANSPALAENVLPDPSEADAVPYFGRWDMHIIAEDIRPGRIAAAQRGPDIHLVYRGRREGGPVLCYAHVVPGAAYEPPVLLTSYSKCEDFTLAVDAAGTICVTLAPLVRGTPFFYKRPGSGWDEEFPLGR